MDVPDDGYRHIGKCTELESLVLMYCRDAGDRSTEHITALPKLRKYFASYNKITDRTRSSYRTSNRSKRSSSAPVMDSLTPVSYGSRGSPICAKSASRGRTSRRTWWMLSRRG
jgi:hypothetical protein